MYRTTVQVIVGMLKATNVIEQVWWTVGRRTGGGGE